MRHVRRHCFLAWRRALRRWRSPPTRHSRSPTGSQTPTLPSPCAKSSSLWPQIPRSSARVKPNPKALSAGGIVSASRGFGVVQPDLILPSAASFYHISRPLGKHEPRARAKPYIPLSSRLYTFHQKVYNLFMKPYIPLPERYIRFGINLY